MRVYDDLQNSNVDEDDNYIPEEYEPETTPRKAERFLTRVNKYQLDKIRSESIPTDISTISITEYIDATLVRYDGNLRQAATLFYTQGNFSRYVFSAIISKIMKDEGRDQAVKFVEEELGVQFKSVYAWLQTYNEFKDRGDEAVRALLYSGNVGVSLSRDIAAAAKKHDLTDEQVIEVIDYAGDENVSTDDVKKKLNSFGKESPDKDVQWEPPEEDEDESRDYIEFTFKLKKGEADYVLNYIDAIGSKFLKTKPKNKEDAYKRGLSLYMIMSEWQQSSKLKEEAMK